MHVNRESDNSIVPTTLANKVVKTTAELVEGRELTKENALQANTSRTQSRVNDVPNGLERVRQAAKRDKKSRFSSLLHYVTIEVLREAYFATKRTAATGTDGVTWVSYGENLEGNLSALHQRLNRGTYQAKPSRRVYIPKTDGQLRPLGVASLEDKILQRAVAKVLNCIYESDFAGFSYGFRPGRQPHTALDSLAIGIRTRKVSWVLDADIKGYFDTIGHDWMMKFLEHRIGDRRILRLIQKWLKAGVVENGKWRPSDGDSPQGASISPLLANVYLHYVLDLWVQHWRKRKAAGDVIIVRWADDFVVGFQHQSDSLVFLAELRERFRRFGLVLHPEKTRLIRFGRFADRDVKRYEGRRRPQTFNFLGFTHYCAVNRNGRYVVRRITIRERLKTKLQEVKAELRKRMHDTIRDQAKWLGAVVRGYFNYHAVPGNWAALGAFRTEVARMWYRTLRRRSQRKRLTWPVMQRHIKKWLPPARILHPWPEQRLTAIIQGRSPVR